MPEVIFSDSNLYLKGITEINYANDFNYVFVQKPNLNPGTIAQFQGVWIALKIGEQI